MNLRSTFSKSSKGNPKEPYRKEDNKIPEIPQTPGKDKPEIERPSKEIPGEVNPDEVETPGRNPEIEQPETDE
jgi:hypothetical protein